MNTHTDTAPATPTDSELALDGNAAAGDFATVFAGDPTSVLVCCGTCGATHALGQLAAYVGGPGTVLRCRSCQAITARIAVTGHGTWLDLSGSSSWRFPAPTRAG